MSVAGYSATPLARKLGIKPHTRLLLLLSPDCFTVGEPSEGVTPDQRPTGAPYDTILLFCASKAVLISNFAQAAARLTVAGGLWVCWPKKASGVKTDLTDVEVRAFGIEAGLVDVKVCAVDETWSGLRFVRRLGNR